MKTKPVKVTIPLTFEGKKFSLVKYSGNWADEMDVTGFSVMSEEELKEWIEYIPKEPFTFGVGSNQEIDYRSVKAFLKNCTIEEISREQAEQLFKLFPYKHERYLDWRDDNYQLIEYSTRCVFGQFPNYKDEEES